MPESAAPPVARIGPPQVVGSVLLAGALGAGVYALVTGRWDAGRLLIGLAAAVTGIGRVTSPVQPGSVRDRRLRFGVGGMALVPVRRAILPA